MTTIAAPTQLDPATVMHDADRDRPLYELIDGVPVEKAMSTRSNLVAARVAFLLMSAYPLSRAYVFIEQPTYCFSNPRSMRRPDVAVVWRGRLPGGGSNEELRIAPDIVVEVVSPTNLYGEVMDRLFDYQGAGVPLVLILHPEHRCVLGYRQDGSAFLLKPGDVLKDNALLPDLQLRVDDLFPEEPLPDLSGVTAQ